MNQSLIIVNPAAGGGSGKNLIEHILQSHAVFKNLETLLNIENIQNTRILTTDKSGLWKKEFQNLVASTPYRIFMVIGGDGTLMDVVSEIYLLKHHKESVIVPLPAGRGNDFLRGLCGYSSKLGDFLSWGMKKKWITQDLDLAQVNDSIFLNMASIGYGGRIVEKVSNQKSFLSKSAAIYQLQGAVTLFQEKDIECQVLVDQIPVYQGKFFGAFVGNGSVNGSGLYWLPKACSSDGQLDGIIFQKPSVIEMARSIKAVKEKKDPSFNFKRFIGNSIEFKFSIECAVEVDGNFLQNTTSMKFSCINKVLKACFLRDS